MSKRSATNAGDKAFLDADQVEGLALTEADWVPVFGALSDDRIAGTVEEEPGGSGVLTTAALDETLESQISATVSEIRRRCCQLQGSYPFELKTDGTAIRYRGSTTCVYEFCLAVSLTRDLSKSPFNELPKSFERLTCHVVEGFLGDGAKCLRAGWPPDGDRPSTFKATIESLAKLTGEWEWSPRSDVNGEPTTVKDGGIDFVVWKYPGDTRPGGLMLLGQCACGNDWPGKLSDLSLDRLSQWVPRPSIAKQIRCFSTPYYVPPQRWIDSATQAHLIFDRQRLVHLAEKHSEKVLAAAKRPYSSLAQIVLAKFQPTSSLSIPAAQALATAAEAPPLEPIALEPALATNPTPAALTPTSTVRAPVSSSGSVVSAAPTSATTAATPAPTWGSKLEDS